MCQSLTTLCHSLYVITTVDTDIAELIKNYSDSGANVRAALVKYTNHKLSP